MTSDQDKDEVNGFWKLRVSLERQFLKATSESPIPRRDGLMTVAFCTVFQEAICSVLNSSTRSLTKSVSSQPHLATCVFNKQHVITSTFIYLSMGRLTPHQTGGPCHQCNFRGDWEKASLQRPGGQDQVGCGEWRMPKHVRNMRMRPAALTPATAGSQLRSQQSTSLSTVI